MVGDEKEYSGKSLRLIEIFPLDIVMAESILQPGTGVIARYSFKGSCIEDLVFRKGDIMTIVAPTEDLNWYKARHVDSREGLVPVNYIQKRSYVKVKAMPWFHGKITREEAEMLLQLGEDGLFLVRESTNFAGDYILCVCYKNRVEHYRVIYKDNKFTIDDEEYFENLSKLVEHYQTDADGLCSILKQFVPKEGNSAPFVDSQAFEKAGWTIKLGDLKFSEVIGKGEFGDDLLGSFQGQNVAVNVLKDNSMKVQPFLVGISVMASLSHRNIVQLVGVVFDEPSIYIVTEYMAKGSLLDYLQLIGRQHAIEQDQINFAIDTCAGMTYLESRQIVHRQLAASNVLISHENVAKISGFGLARGINCCDCAGHFPVKWTPPEALLHGNFSSKSDVWSFGILLWEIYTFGRVPYPNIPLEDVVEYIEKGHRLADPEEGPSEMYDIMLQTWNLDPERRPNFIDLLKELEYLRCPWRVTERIGKIGKFRNCQLM